MKKKFYLLFTLSFTIVANLYCQDHPLYNQTYFNPYLYNPSYVASNEKTEAFLTYRQQWSNINDAPQVTTFNLQYATSSNVALGMIIQSESNVGLRTNTGYLTFGYKLPIAEMHHLKFGLSLGVLHNGLDLDELTDSGDQTILSDPALMNALDNTYYLSGQFGVHYQYKNLVIGFALPKLMSNDVNSDKEFNNVDFEVFDQNIINASYLFELSPLFKLRPHLLYRQINKNQTQVEGTGLIYYDDLIWLGAGYRLDYGTIGHFGLNIKDWFKLSYSYEFSGISGNTFSNGSHEFNLNISLGNKKTKRKKNTPLETKTIKQKNQPTLKTEETSSEIEEDQPEKEDEFKTAVIEQEDEEKETELTNTESNIQDPSVKIDKGDPTGEYLKPGNYIVVGAFLNVENASKYSQQLTQSGFENHIGKIKTKEFHYVYIESMPDLNNAIDEKNKIRLLDKFYFKDAWVLHLK